MAEGFFALRNAKNLIIPSIFLIFFVLDAQGLGRASSLSLNRDQIAELKHVVPRQLFRPIPGLPFQFQGRLLPVPVNSRRLDPIWHSLSIKTPISRPVVVVNASFVRSETNLIGKSNQFLLKSSASRFSGSTRRPIGQFPTTSPPKRLFLLVKKPTTAPFPGRFRPPRPPILVNPSIPRKSKISINLPTKEPISSDEPDKEVLENAKVIESLLFEGNFTSNSSILSPNSSIPPQTALNFTDFKEKPHENKGIIVNGTANSETEASLDERFKLIVVPELQQDLTTYEHLTLDGAKALLRSQMKPTVIIPKRSINPRLESALGSVRLPVIPSISVLNNELPFGTERFTDRRRAR